MILLNSLILLKRRIMGNQIKKIDSTEIRNHQQTLTYSNINDIECQQDPLNNFLKKQPTFNIRTLQDIKKNSKFDFPIKKLPSVNSIASKDNNQNCMKQLCSKSQVDKVIEKENINDFRIIDSCPIRRKILANDSEFNNRAVSQDMFIKINTEPIQRYYDLKELLGEGSFGKVFRAIDKKTNEERAIKTLKLKMMNQIRKKEFLTEMTLLSKLNHPSIITLYQLYHNKDKYYVVMEYCKGGAVVDMISKMKNKSQTIIANIMKQLLGALSYMHSLDIIHRDIKLDNIVFLKSLDSKEDEDEQDQISIRIIDFGTAVLCQRQVKKNFPIAGTLSYLAPEVLKGNLTNKSDVWSSGVLMYILLTGVSPFRSNKQNLTKENILKKVIDFGKSPLSELSQEAKNLLSLMLERDFSKRISANDALHHDWFKAKGVSRPISMSNLEQLENYYRGNNLITMIESYLSLRKVSQDERQRLAAIFTKIDSDGNGMIEISELIQTMKKHVSNFNSYSEEDINDLVRSIDKNQSGKIDFNEFIVAMQNRSKLFIKESLSEAFQHYDRDKTGYLEVGQLKQILNSSDHQQVEYFINEIDKDNDHQISKQEFINYLLLF